MKALLIPADAPAHTTHIHEPTQLEKHSRPVWCRTLGLVLNAHLDPAGAEPNQNQALLESLGLHGRILGNVTITGADADSSVPEPVIDLSRTLTPSAYAIDPSKTRRATTAQARQDFEVFLPRTSVIDRPTPAASQVLPRVHDIEIDDELDSAKPLPLKAERLAAAHAHLTRLTALHRLDAAAQATAARHELTRTLTRSADEILDILDLARTQAEEGTDSQLVHRAHTLAVRLLTPTRRQ